MTGRGTANLLTRTTAILATLFMALSLALAMLNKGTVIAPSILDAGPPPAAPTAPAGAPSGGPGGGPAEGGAPGSAPNPAPAAPANPAPSVPTN
jgi:preprotein translocase subunit SecG